MWGRFNQGVNIIVIADTGFDAGPDVGAARPVIIRSDRGSDGSTVKLTSRGSSNQVQAALTDPNFPDLGYYYLTRWQLIRNKSRLESLIQANVAFFSASQDEEPAFEVGAQDGFRGIFTSAIENNMQTLFAGGNFRDFYQDVARDVRGMTFRNQAALLETMGIGASRLVESRPFRSYWSRTYTLGAYLPGTYPYGGSTRGFFWQQGSDDQSQ
jgi:hypothetical protein